MIDVLALIWASGFIVAVSITFMYFSCVTAAVLFVLNLINIAASFFWPSKRRAVVLIILSLLPLIVGLIGAGIGTVCVNLASCVATNAANSTELKDIMSSMNFLAWLSAGIGMLVSIINTILASLGCLISQIILSNHK